jgi:uncharacterized protein YjbI with pentapeptide repeats
MANPEHFSILIGDVQLWNRWREDNTTIRPDLVGASLSYADLRGTDLHNVDFGRANFRKADLVGVDLNGANLYKANLTRANFSGVNLSGAYLSGADLYRANLTRANLSATNLSGANLSGTNLSGTNLSGTNLSGANLSGANLNGANLNGANLNGANLSRADLREADLTAASLERAIFVYTRCDKAIFTRCRIHGVSAWDLQLADTQQTDLIITPKEEPDITVDNLEVAQFVYLLLNNQRIRHVIDTITSKIVLILGRFTQERKVVLDTIRNQLRQRDYLPILFDFEKPRRQTTLETINTLAGLSRFVIADITDAKSVLQELMIIVPHRPLLPIQPVLLASQEEPGMFDFFRAFPWFLETFRYHEQEELVESLQVNVILPAEEKAKELVSSLRK